MGPAKKCEKALAGWEPWAMTQTVAGKQKPCRHAAGAREGRVWVGEEGRMGLYGQKCAEVAHEAECEHGRGMLAAPLLLLTSLGDGGRRDKDHTEVT